MTEFSVRGLSIGKDKNNNYVIGYVSKYFADVPNATKQNVLTDELINNYIPSSFIKINKLFNIKKSELTFEELKEIGEKINTKEFDELYKKVYKKQLDTINQINKLKNELEK